MFERAYADSSFHRVGKSVSVHPMKAARHAMLSLVPFSFLLLSCSKRIPDEVASAVETNLPLAIRIAEDNAKSCAALKASAPFQPNPMAAPPPPPSPAAGSPLATDTHVVDVIVMCSWPDPRDPSGSAFGGTGFPKLKGKAGVPVRAVTMPEDMARNTCKKDRDHCEQVVVPSRHVVDERSADIRVTRKTPDGTIEVTVILGP